MDRVIYVAMTGASANLDQQSSVANNLANVNTTAFRAELSNFNALQLKGNALPTRAFAVTGTAGADMTPGMFQGTGRELDVAVGTTGWLVVRPSDGSEALTRDGAMAVSANGTLTTHNGLPVLSDQGNNRPGLPIVIPPNSEVVINKDGTVSAITPQVGAAPITQTVGRLKLVDPPATTLSRREDGLFKSTAPLNASANVRLEIGSLEGSNVNPMSQMVRMIELARQYDLNTRVITSATDNDKSATQILTLTA